MPALTIVLDGEGAAKEVAPGTTVHVLEPFTITALAGGMQSGKPSIALLIPLPDGRTVVAETSLALLLTAADAFRAKYGDPR